MSEDRKTEFVGRIVEMTWKEVDGKCLVERLVLACGEEVPVVLLNELWNDAMKLGLVDWRRTDDGCITVKARNS